MWFSTATSILILFILHLSPFLPCGSNSIRWLIMYLLFPLFVICTVNMIISHYACNQYSLTFRRQAWYRMLFELFANMYCAVCIPTSCTASSKIIRWQNLVKYFHGISGLVIWSDVHLCYLSSIGWFFHTKSIQWCLYGLWTQTWTYWIIVRNFSSSNMSHFQTEWGHWNRPFQYSRFTV